MLQRLAIPNLKNKMNRIRCFRHQVKSQGKLKILCKHLTRILGSQKKSDLGVLEKIDRKKNWELILKDSLGAKVNALSFES